MKILLLMVVLMLVSCAHYQDNKPYVHQISWNKAMLNPSIYEGRSIEICGWFEANQEFCALSNPEDNAYTEIWVTPESDICLPVNVFENPLQGWAVVSGVFYSYGGFGHLGGYETTLHKAKIQFLNQACQNQ